jgi:hypothetical protein
MSDLLRFQDEISRAMERLVAPRINEELRRLKSEPPKPFRIDVPFLSDRPASLTADERFSADAFREFFEIGETVERLKDFEVYIRRFPFARTRITRERYLRVHIEAYFHECHILRERLVAYAKRITRAYKSGGIRERARIAGNELEELVSRGMAHVIAVRNRHVHEYRFDETRLSNFGGIELIARNSDSPGWDTVVAQQYKIVRQHWSKWAAEMNEAVVLLLDRYFAILYPILFVAPAEIRAPSARAT